MAAARRSRRRSTPSELETATRWRLAVLAQIEAWAGEEFEEPYDDATRRVVMRRLDRLELFLRSFFPEAGPAPIDPADAWALIVLPQWRALRLARRLFRGGPGIAADLEAQDLTFNLDWFQPRDPLTGRPFS